MEEKPLILMMLCLVVIYIKTNLNLLNKANEELKIKHPLHVHCNNLGVPGNIKLFLRQLKPQRKENARACSILWI